MQTADPLVIVDECLANTPDNLSQQERLYRLRHLLLQDGAAQQHREAEFKKITTVVEQLTAPAQRIGTLLGLTPSGMAHVLVGGGEFYTNIDPRIDPATLQLGIQILVNEAYALIGVIGYDQSGPIVKVKDTLVDGRIRVDHETGRQHVIVNRGTAIQDLELKPGDEIRLDGSHRLAIERIEQPQSQSHILEEAPSITWKHIGGQHTAIESIRRAIEYPLLHAQTFDQYQFIRPKGFLLHGPPGCGKTLIGQATAASLGQLMKEPETAPSSLSEEDAHQTSSSQASPITGGIFFHIKGPEILNMWVGESERMIRDLFTQARERRKAGFLPVIFIDEAESILGTRRALRAYNLSNTLVPMFCSELDGIDSLLDVIVILASNRPDLIDPAVLRPGRIDRKIRVIRPNPEEATAIINIHLSHDIPLDATLVAAHKGDHAAAWADLVDQIVNAIFQQSDETRVLSIRLRNGSRDTFYYRDLVSGGILASIVRRGKERAIERTIQGDSHGVTVDDFLTSISDEYHEGEILPPDDSAEEWLKLLDHHPEQVVGISSIRKGRVKKEQRIRKII